jgi:hypothetical protein
MKGVFEIKSNEYQYSTLLNFLFKYLKIMTENICQFTHFFSAIIANECLILLLGIIMANLS